MIKYTVLIPHSSCTNQLMATQLCVPARRTTVRQTFVGQKETQWLTIDGF